MAPKPTNTPIMINSDDDDDDDEEEEEEEPSPVTASLKNAINSATRTILINTLLEVCERNGAGKDIVEAMLLPSSAISGPAGTAPRGTKRSAPSSNVIDRVCQHCGRQFTANMQLRRDCIYHPGMF